MKLDTVFDTDDEVVFLYKWFLKRDKKPIDNFIFYLHYHVTSLLYLTASLIITVSMYIMDPIDCLSDKMVDDIIDNFCFYHSTYTITNISIVGDIHGLQEELVPHPGIANVLVKDSSVEGAVKYHHYYLWVAPFLAINAASFYFSRCLWKKWEGSSLSFILEEKQCLSSEEVNSKKQLASYIASARHHKYFYKLLTCEVINLLIAIAQLYIMDMFLGFELLKLTGLIPQLIYITRPFDRDDAIESMFPKVTSCTFHSFGPSGNVVNTDALCILPVNVLNEKVFGILYLWIIAVLIPLSILAVLYRLVSLILRKIILKVNLSSEMAFSKNQELKYLEKHLGIGNWQLLLSAGWNMDSWELTEIVRELFYIKKQDNMKGSVR